MADMPDLIISTDEEQEEFPFLLAEIPKPWGVHIVEVGYPALSDPAYKGNLKFWWFKEREALIVFAASLARDYWSEGVKAVPGYLLLRTHDTRFRTTWQAQTAVEPLVW